MSFFGFHPVVEEWFFSRFDAPTEPQKFGWPSIADEKHTLISAPTGSGKTLTAFLGCIDRLLKDSLAGSLNEEVRVVYVSPLRALSNDMHRNLEVPLREITDLAAEIVPSGDQLALFENETEEQRAILRVGLRTGDTSSYQRTKLNRKPPHILVTTPESLYLMLTAERSRETLRNVETVIVDEIHALVRDKRGSHLSLTLERLEALSERRIQRIGLSATQKPIEQIAEYLIGNRDASFQHVVISQNQSRDSQGAGLLDNSRDSDPSIAAERETVHIVDIGHSRELDLAIEVPPSELGPICSHEQWEEIYKRLVELIQTHRSTLIFVNTRRMAERVTHQLTELLGEEHLGSHHGSLAMDIRLTTERKLKSGELKAVVATASLELGIDVGFIDLVIQIGSTRSIATFLQRIGRSGHSLGLTPKGRLFALTRDELVECMAVMRAVKSGKLDRVIVPQAPLDVLAQQIVAEVCSQDWKTDELFPLFRRSYSYRNLSRDDFDRTVEFLSEGISKAQGRSRVYLHHDQVGRRLRARKGSRIAASSNAGAIPEIASFRVVVQPENTVVGTLDEDFAVESQRGDVFLLGNTSWRILHIRGGDVTVVDAQGAPPSVPFWNGEAPGRSFELSEELSNLREDLEKKIEEVVLDASNKHPGCSKQPGYSPDQTPENWDDLDFSKIVGWLEHETNASEFAAQQVVEYIAAQKAALGVVPSQKKVVFERFFDESGGMQMVVHAPFGSRITKAWGFAMRKRFCRSFDFELQATADDDGFILSLGPQHSFPIESLFSMLNRQNVQQMLEQAVLLTPVFQIRWRWNVTRALLVIRRQNGKKVPPALQRFRADDLLTAVFPRLTGCQEEHTGPIPLPDHPLVNQTMHDALHEALDIDGLHRVMEEVAQNQIAFIGRDSREPSPFAYELLNAYPYAFLDGGEIQERRTRAVSTRRGLSVESVNDLGRLDPEAIRQVCVEAQPHVRNADELHDALLTQFLLLDEETASWGDFLLELRNDLRAALITLPNDSKAWVAAERMNAVKSAYSDHDLSLEPPITTPESIKKEWDSLEARLAMLRGYLEVCGPIVTSQLAQRFALTESQAFAALEALEGEGVVLRGHFTPTQHPGYSKQPGCSSGDDKKSNKINDIEWCHRRLLARIHRLTLQGLRREIEPVAPEVFQRFLFQLHGIPQGQQRAGTNGLFEVISQLQGLDISLVNWERDILPLRISGYRPEFLDELCLTGETAWGRLYPPKRDVEKSKPMANLTRVAPISLFLRTDLEWLSKENTQSRNNELSSPALQVLELLEKKGALFAADLQEETQMLADHLNDALGELITRGYLTADGFGGVRKMIAKKKSGRERYTTARSRIQRTRKPEGQTGRWSIWRRSADSQVEPENEKEKARHRVEEWAWQLLRRWGVVFRDLVYREPGAPAWWELLQVLRRMEARGEIRGGRFVTGVGGEQFALGETIRQLRQIRDEENPSELTVISSADPLNLTGVLGDASRIPTGTKNRVAYWNGTAVAAFVSGEVKTLKPIPQKIEKTIRERLNGQLMLDAIPSLDKDDDIPGSARARTSQTNRNKNLRRIPRPIL